MQEQITYLSRLSIIVYLYLIYNIQGGYNMAYAINLFAGIPNLTLSLSQYINTTRLRALFQIQRYPHFN